MKDAVINIQEEKWTDPLESDNRFSFFSSNNKGKIKARLGFIYFVALVSSLIVLFAR